MGISKYPHEDHSIRSYDVVLLRNRQSQRSRLLWHRLCYPIGGSHCRFHHCSKQHQTRSLVQQLETSGYQHQLAVGHQCLCVDENRAAVPAALTPFAAGPPTAPTRPPACTSVPSTSQ